MNTRRAMSTAAALVASGYLLSGCGSDEDPAKTATSSSASGTTSSASSSPSTTAANPDGEIAIKVVTNLEKVSGQLYEMPGMRIGELGAYSAGGVFSLRSKAPSEARARGEKRSGAKKLLDLSASKKSSTRQQVVACVDLSDVKVTNKAGEAIELDAQRYKQVYTVEKSDGPTQDGKWRVTAEQVTTSC